MGAYQPLRSGMVQEYIEVTLDDSTLVSAWLPQDQKIWDKVDNSLWAGKHLSVEIKRKATKKYWEFVKFFED